METIDPILIAGCPRSGTTMLAGLLFYHGVWIGNSKTTDYPGTNPKFGSENVDIKNLMKEKSETIGYRNWRTPLPDQELVNFNGTKEKILKLVPKNTLWLVKTSWTLTFSEFWIDNFRKAKWVFPVRSDKMILNSMNRHPSMRRRPENMKIRFIEALKERQEEISKHVDHIFVDVNKISNRYQPEIDILFKFVGIKHNKETSDKWLRPEILKK